MTSVSRRCTSTNGRPWLKKRRSRRRRRRRQCWSSRAACNRVSIVFLRLAHCASVPRTELLSRRRSGCGSSAMRLPCGRSQCVYRASSHLEDISARSVMINNLHLEGKPHACAECRIGIDWHSTAGRCSGGSLYQVLMLLLTTKTKTTGYQSGPGWSQIPSTPTLKSM
jgi:hypothetical protein